MARRPAGSLTYREAAALLGCHYETIRDWVAAGTFTDLRPLGKGRGRQGFLPKDEIEAYREGGEPAVAELRRLRDRAALTGSRP
jgi:excisionase family DNA binding protein